MTYKNLFETPSYTISLLRPAPAVAYLTDYKEYVAFWNGIIMPLSAALYIATRPGNVYPSDAVKQKIDDSFRRLRAGGALRQGDLKEGSRYMINGANVLADYERVMRPHIALMLQNGLKSKDLFDMLNVDNAQEISLSNPVDS